MEVTRAARVGGFPGPTPPRYAKTGDVGVGCLVVGLGAGLVACSRAQRGGHSTGPTDTTDHA